jgi:hypothetical protein
MVSSGKALTDISIIELKITVKLNLKLSKIENKGSHSFGAVAFSKVTLSINDTA